MKKIIRNTHTLVIYTLLFITLFLISSCDSDDPEISDRESLIEALTGTWTVDEDSYILIDNQDITDFLIGFEISIDKELRFTTNNDQLQFQEFPWPTEGTFTLNDELTRITRNDGLVITLDLNDDESVLDFEFNADESGRAASAAGGWKCGFSKK